MARTAAAICLLATLALAACSTTKPPPVDPNLFPTNYKKEILDTMIKVVPAGTDVREAFISAPVLTPVGQGQVYSACIRSRTRDAFGNYSPDDYRIAYFYGGHLNQLVKATPEQCANAAYTPFVEFDQAYRPNANEKQEKDNSSGSFNPFSVLHGLSL